MCDENQAETQRDPKGKDAFLVNCTNCGRYLISDFVLKANMLNDGIKKNMIEKIKNHYGEEPFYIQSVNLD